MSRFFSAVLFVGSSFTASFAVEPQSPSPAASAIPDPVDTTGYTVYRYNDTMKEYNTSSQPEEPAVSSSSTQEVKISGVPTQSDRASFTDQGGFWLGSGFTFFTLGSEGSSSRENVIIASPFFRSFIAPHFALGFRVDWFRIGENDASMSVFSPGFDMTFANGRGGNIFFFTPGVKINCYSQKWNDYYYGGSHSISNSGTTIFINFGLIVKISDIIGLQFEPGFDFMSVESHTSNMFHFSVGFCAFSKKAAVSFLEKFPGL